MSERLIRLKEVQEMTGLCRSAIYTVAGFPRPIKLPSNDGSKGRAVAWVESEVSQWITSTIAASRRA